MTTSQLFNSIKFLTALFFQQQIITDVAGLNIALNKNGTYCNNKPLSKIMFDGDKNQSRSEIMIDSCLESNAYVDIALGAMYDIHYVIVYAGNGTKRGQLDNFEVYVGDQDILVASSEFWGPSVMSEQGMRVNCEAPSALVSTVRIRSRANEGLSISEIEVHTLASGIPGETSKLYQGCFRKFGEHFIFHDSPLFTGCQQSCLTKGYIYFGIKNNIACHCGGDYDEIDEIPLKTCDVYCDNGFNCGSRAAFSVYLASVRLPAYKGCLIVSESSLESKIQGNMTIAKCLHHCDNYHLALLKDGNSCFCYNGTIPSMGSQYRSCTVECSGNSSEICGGKRYLSVYETCLSGKYASVRCSKLFKCAGSYDMYGLCKDGCKQGYWDDHCIERGKKRLPPPKCLQMNPCLNKTNTECIVQNDTVKCECLNGYVRINKLSECEDIDECKFEPCDTRNAVCSNTNGSYICDCLPGFGKIIFTDICTENTSVENELYVDHLRYWMMMAYLSPLLTVLFMIMMMCVYSPGSSESVPRSELRRNRKISQASSIVSTWTSTSGRQKVLP